MRQSAGTPLRRSLLESVRVCLRFEPLLLLWFEPGVTVRAHVESTVPWPSRREALP